MATWGTKNKGKRKVANEKSIDNELEKEKIKKFVAEYKNKKDVEQPPKEKPKKRLPVDLTKPFNENEEKLLYIIIAQCCEDYRNAYIRGNEGELLSCKRFLQSGRVELYTQGNFEGQGLLDTMNKDLMQKYGAFKKGHRLRRKK